MHFLTRKGRDAHEERHCPWRRSAQAAQSLRSCRVLVGLTTSSQVRRQGQALLPAHRKPPAPEPTLTRLDVTTCFDGGDGKLINVRLRPRCASASDAVRLRLKVLRPLDPPNAYGLQPFKVAPASAAALPPMQLDKACSVRAMGVHATLAMEPAARSGPPHV